MYQPLELARFALSEFERGLDGLTDEEARTRLTKADGTQMNAIAWTVGHISGHWLNRPGHLDRYDYESSDATPPSLDEALKLIREAKDATDRWLPSADDALLSTKPGGPGEESVGTGVMRAVLHTWFHTGEINAVRQMLGHPPIDFVGEMLGNLEWRSEGEVGQQ